MLINTKTGATLYLMLAAIVVCLVIGFASGWIINSWRLGKTIAEQKARADGLTVRIEEQNLKVTDLDNKRKEADKRREEAERNVRKHQLASQKRINSLRQRNPILGSCDATIKELSVMLREAR